MNVKGLLAFARTRLRFCAPKTWKLRNWSPVGEPLHLTTIENLDEYRAHSRAIAPEHRRRRQIEQELATGSEPFPTAGFCHVCGLAVDFTSDYHYASRDESGRMQPNWRERLQCPRCRLNNRMRAAIHVFRQSCAPRRDTRVYLTEQTTPLFAWFSSRYPGSVGSEYLGGGIALGSSDARGIRNESVTSLSFPDESFDHILSFDVMEHVPAYEQGFQEFLRCLRPGGGLLFTVPFLLESQKNLARAFIREDGEIEHFLPPEYHGDPLSAAGCLCFQHFGWELLDQLRAMGFASVSALFYWSREYGYLGGEQVIFLARKGGA